MVKKYELPPQKDKEPGALRQGMALMGTWTGKRKEGVSTTEQDLAPTGSVRQGLNRMTTWTGLGGNKDEQSSGSAPAKGRKIAEEEEEDDDRRIRFTIGGSGRRLTKTDFLNELRQLDPKARVQILNESDAPEAMKDLARKDASADTPGSDRLFASRAAQLGSSRKTAKHVAASMAKDMGADIDPDIEAEEIEKEEKTHNFLRTDSPRSAVNLQKPSTTDSPSTDIPETAAERRRRENVLKNIDDEKPRRSVGKEIDRETPAERRRQEALIGAQSSQGRQGHSGETAAERRRREAALGLAGGEVALEESDSDDDNTERVPQRRGIRFAEEPIRGRKN